MLQGSAWAAIYEIKNPRSLFEMFGKTQNNFFISFENTFRDSKAHTN